MGQHRLNILSAAEDERAPLAEYADMDAVSYAHAAADPESDTGGAADIAEVVNLVACHVDGERAGFSRVEVIILSVG